VVLLLLSLFFQSGAPVSLVRNSAAGKKLDSARGGQAPSEGGQKFLPPNPPSFLPARAIGF